MSKRHRARFSQYLVWPARRDEPDALAHPTDMLGRQGRVRPAHGLCLRRGTPSFSSITWTGAAA